MIGNVAVHPVEDDPERQHAVLVNTLNLRVALAGAASIELVAHAPGVTLLTGKTGLAVEGVDTVDSGVAHLAARRSGGRPWRRSRRTSRRRR